MNSVLNLLIFAMTLSLLSGHSFAIGAINNEIQVSPPLNWEPNPTNNSTSMIWFQNSTKSVFAIIKAPDNLPIPVFFINPFMTGYLKYKGVLEDADKVEFGHGNQGYRYFLNLSSPSELLNSSSGLIPKNEFLKEIPQGYDVPFKGMLILTQKHNDLFAIIFLNPKEEFDSMLSEIQPTLDSIQLTSYTKMEN
ncbi:MAG TPA: hypothetical protein VJ772_11035 [Nitrososphaeraceae archaeon]|nr:hypothetical protein [Nitrososphaeraceae archaeon]